MPGTRPGTCSQPAGVGETRSRASRRIRSVRSPISPYCSASVDELQRLLRAPSRVVPPGERLHAGDVVGDQIDHGSEGQFQLPALDGCPQVLDHPQPGAGGLVEPGIEELHARALTLGPVHRRIGPLQEQVGVGAVIGPDRDPDAAAEGDRSAGAPEGLAQQGLQLTGDPDHLLRVVHPSQDHGELVPSEPRDGVAGPQTTAQPLGHLAQDLVPGLVTLGIVDVLETVQIDQKQGRAPAAVGIGAEMVVETLVQQFPVGQPRQRVVEGTVPDLALGLVTPRSGGHDVGERRQEVDLVLAEGTLLPRTGRQGSDAPAGSAQGDPGAAAHRRGADDAVERHLQVGRPRKDPDLAVVHHLLDQALGRRVGTGRAPPSRGSGVAQPPDVVGQRQAGHGQVQNPADRPDGLVQQLVQVGGGQRPPPVPRSPPACVPVRPAPRGRWRWTGLRRRTRGPR